MCVVSSSKASDAIKLPDFAITEIVLKMANTKNAKNFLIIFLLPPAPLGLYSFIYTDAWSNYDSTSLKVGGRKAFRVRNGDSTPRIYIRENHHIQS